MYYTYIHSTPDGDVFYVGKGQGRRAYSTSDRSIAWREVVDSNNGINIKILNFFESENEAFEDEEKLIEYYVSIGSQLVNATSGGRGVKGCCKSEAQREHIRTLLTGYVHKIVTCPICGTTGGETSMKRWHFDKCTGSKGKVSARVTVDGERIFIGSFNTKEEAINAQNIYILKNKGNV
jgi:hypothetical protein